MGCMGVNIAWTPRWLRERGGFWSHAPPPPLFKGPKCLRGVRVKDCTWAPPMAEGSNNEEEEEEEEYGLMKDVK